MTDYTPTTEVIRQAVSFPRERLGEPRPIKPEAFYRWLEQVKAEARHEGFVEGLNHNMKNRARITAELLDNLQDWHQSFPTEKD